MIVLIFLLLTATTLLILTRQRKPAIYLFLITLALAGFWFAHHVTSHLNLQL